MGGVPGNEHPASLVRICNGKSKVPEANVLKLHFKFGADRLLHVGLEVKVVCCRAGWNRRVKKPGVAQVNATKKLPVALEFRLQDVVKRLAGIAVQKRMQALRVKDQKNHHPVVIVQGLRDAHLLPHFGATAVTTDHIGCRQRAALLAFSLVQGHSCTFSVLFYRLCIPAEKRLHSRQFCQALTKHSFSFVLG